MVAIHVVDWAGDAETAVIEESARLGLRISSNGRLASYPGSRHWHLKNGRQPGTLEVTVHPDTPRLWVAFHSNRTGDGWVADSARALAASLADRLGGRIQE